MTWQLLAEIDSEGSDGFMPGEVHATVENADGDEWELEDVHVPADRATGRRLTTEAVEEAVDAHESGKEVWVDVAFVGDDAQVGTFSVGRPGELD